MIPIQAAPLRNAENQPPAALNPNARRLAINTICDLASKALGAIALFSLPSPFTPFQNTLLVFLVLRAEERMAEIFPEIPIFI